MGNVLGRSRGKISDVDRAILSLKTQRRKLEDQRKRTDALIEREVVVAKTLVAQGKKERALLALKKKRLHTQQSEWLDQLLLNVEETLANVEGAARQKHLFDTLQKSNTALRQLQKELPLEAVEQLMSDTAEAKEYEEQVQSMFGESWTNTDEAAAEAELEEMEAQLQQEEILEMPAVPSTKPPIKEKAPAVTADKVEEEKRAEPVAA